MPAAEVVRWCLGGLWGVLVCLAGPVQAQSCWTAGSSGLSFGSVTAAAAVDTQGSVDVSCQGVYGSVTYVRLCLAIAEGSPVAGVNPRWMKNYSANAQMAFNLYSDAARTQLIGIPPTGAGGVPYTLTMQVPANGQATMAVPVFGRVPAGQNLPAGNYQSEVNNSTLRWATATGAFPASCDVGEKDGTASFYMGVGATFSNSCTIAISQASDMDFGTADALSNAITSTSQITLACPNNTAWRVGLNDGLNAVVAGQRRMAGPTPDFLAYELYRDAGRTQRWGNDTAGGTNTVNGSGNAQTNPTVLTVYGRVPAQTVGTPGVYADTITVTLTY